MAGNIRQPIDTLALSRYIQQNVPSIELPFKLKQFNHGQSNPTYEITSLSGEKFVLRKKPPGKLVSKSAHRVEKEFEVLTALAQTDVPVPKTFAYCEDEAVLGTPFYIMEFLDGRIFEDPWLPNMSPAARTDIWKEAVRTLGRLHSVNLSAVGLHGWKRPSAFYNRQIQSLDRVSLAQAKTLSKISRQEVGRLPYYEELIRFFTDAELQPADRKTLVHGDFKLDNLVFHKTEPRVIGILDWEMATEGHPLSDYVNLVSPFLWAAEQVPSKFRSGAVIGLPSLEQCRQWYCEAVGWDTTQDMEWAVAFANFRTAIIMQGIMARLVTGQASGVEAKQFALQSIPYALWSYARAQKIKVGKHQPSKL
ncbi:kinase-like domain-containing protein [Pyrenochaeta sp. MPI-SDFR-AT-0127]|nr:kinase-like domain-containing protein [Pyrenochaeta sp. MPI-SDFR-AT-0127]